MTQHPKTIQDEPLLALDDAQVGQSEREGTSLLAVMSLLLRYLPVIIWFSLAFGLAAAALTALRARPLYVSVSTFATQGSSSSSVSRYAGLAAQFGISVPTSSSGESLWFYAKLLKSPSILEEVAKTQYFLPEQRDGAPAVRGNLADVLELEGGNATSRIASAAGQLEQMISTDIDQDAGILKLETTAPRAGLAVLINRRLLQLVEEFNAVRRKSEASAERKFVESRLEEARRKLRDAEYQLQNFLERNRNYSASPQLTFQAQRLQRGVALRQEVYTSLAQAYEQARMEEVHNTPVITIIDEPSRAAVIPVRIAARAVLGMLIGAVLALALIFGYEGLRRHREQNPEEFDRLLATTRASLRRVIPGRH